MVDYDAAGNITEEKLVPTMTISGWSETPYRLSSANVRPEFLGISELREYLRFNSDFPETLLAPFRTQLQYRWALALDLLRRRDHGYAAWDRLLAARDHRERRARDRAGLYDEFPHPPFSRAWGRRPRLADRRPPGRRT